MMFSAPDKHSDPVIAAPAEAQEADVLCASLAVARSTLVHLLHCDESYPSLN